MAMREEVWAIVRAAVEEAMGPLVARQRELEARVERAERGERDREASQARGARPGQTVLAAAPPPPVIAFAPATAAAVVAKPAVPLYDVAPGSVTDPGMTTIPDLKVAPSTPSLATLPRGSVAPQGYGVTVMNPTPRPSLDLESVGAVDITGFDGGRAKRRVASTVVILMLLIIAGAVTMTVLSHS